jgi:Holliday junction resolvase RusA-like endonuclease
MTLEKWILINLPFLPLSVNEAYAWYPKRHKSDKYKAFEVEMIKHMAKIPKYEITGNKWLSVKYIFHFPLLYKNGNIRKRDVSNFEKVLSDSLHYHIKWFDDEKIKQLEMIKEDSEKEWTEIFIYEI